ncbi:DNA-binding response regulator, OmpR family, contains REC and winged-helix (wHTH) domain [Clostridium intestinale DSM 6191]|uniref:Stage 0 sporulation protein A homolog n=2 Tax=Clostridium intestinale TaxID=36845 RepID=A0A1M5WL00_9CLOT|nr:DNA-binding response regulator, OmpR family, contains REC and winged-helix (wHTH) domain [Clostridium intestinale DSM 6191]
MNKNIMIVDDEKEIRELLRLYIEKDGYSVIQAKNGLEALKQAKSMQVDLAVIDIMMPELDGYQLIKALRENSNIPIIIVSAKTENHEKILGLDLGADDYVTKPFDPLEVIARIKAQLRRYNGYVADSEVDLLIAGELCMDIYACKLNFGRVTIPLTATEFNIMKLFMQSPGRVYTKQQIYEAAWQEGSIVDDNTVMVAISKLRGKLPEEGAVSIGTVRGLGYRLEVCK